ncbi:MAG TPA: ATP-binding protein [Thermoanaerobaculia bacterium]|jgi:signal transduction histidine kinase
MLQWFQRAPIRQKLMLIALLTTGGTLLLAGAAIIYFNVQRFRAEMERDLQSLADIVAQNSTAALSFHDPAAETDTLSALKARPSIVGAAIYDRQGTRFVHVEPNGGVQQYPIHPGRDGTVSEDGAVGVFRPILLKKERIGTVYLRSNLSDLVARARAQAITVLAVFVASGIVALVLSSRLQRLISGPILDLAGTARAVSERQDYSIRAARRSSDELGALVDAFNGMLGQIQQRDSELQEAKEVLEARVQERTRELELRNEELRQSNKELDDFAYIASHDLKEPLRGIHNFSNFLIEDYADKLDEEGRSKLQTLMRLTRRMETLIDSLLQFSRLGRVDLAVDRVDLNEIVAEILDSLAISLRQENVEVRVPRPLPAVRSDRVRVGEIFYNLVVNAMKYNDKPRKWIEIGWLENRGGPPVFYVRDNGIGIPEKHHDAVFRIFKRLHGRDQFGGGTGAGLTIVKKIIERHHGRIWLQSAPDQGTTFYFTLQEGEVRVA